MKKKLLVAILAITAAICCVLGFAACSEPSDKVAVESVTLNKTTLTLEIDGTETLTATVTPDNATNKTVNWQSSAPAVASVDNAGKVTAKTAGSATITATADGKKAECAVTVNPADTKMTAQEWQAGFNAFATAKNFHLTLSVLDVKTGEVKMNGDTYYDKGGDIERIFVKDGNKYYRYDKTNAQADWTKAEATESTYDDIVNSDAYNLVLGSSQAFGSNYSSFDYSNEKYAAATINVTTGFTLKDIEVTVRDGTVIKIVCTQAGVNGSPDTLVTIDGIGTTEIPIPKIKEPTKGLQYRIPKNKDYAEVTGLTVSADTDMNIMIAAEYQGKPVTTIADSAFSGGTYSSSLLSVIIPDSVTNIGTLAFSGCTKLANITIPDSVTSIGSNAFKNTAWLSNQPDGLVYAGKVAYQYKGDKTQLTSIAFNRDAVSIAPMAFYECEYLTDVVIYDTVKSIGNQAFYGCTSLEYVTIKSDLERIEAQAFRNCELAVIVIPESVTYIGSWAFAGTTLKTISYDGTQAQWTAMKKDANWNGTEEGTIHCKVVCKDGDIEIS